jgi:glycosyltransferase involved in cell wall biosynthesis
MTVPFVSAVIPTRYRPEVVHRAIESALAQSMTNLEVIVVIDGPDKATEESLATITDPRVRVIALAEQVGGSEARNTGVRAARAPWIALLDDDDEWLPQKLQVQLEAAESLNAEYPVIYSRYTGRSPIGDFVMAARLPGENEPVSEYLFCRSGLRFGETGLGSSELLAPTRLMTEVPFKVGLRKHQDWDWVLRAAQHPGVKLLVVPELLAIYYMDDVTPRVSNNAEWRFSLDWVQERVHLLTPKAYSFFIATECATRAKKVDAGIGVYLVLFREFLFRGSPRWRSLGLFLGFTLIPINLRNHLRKLLAPRTDPGPAMPQTEPSK